MGSSVPVENTLVLVVDGIRDQRYATLAHLRDEGFQVAEAADSPAALQIIQSIRPNVILISAQLDDVDGVDFCDQLRSLPNLPPFVILMLLPDLASLHEEAYASGADDVLVTPPRPTLLLRHVRLMAELAAQRSRAIQAERRAHQIFHENRAVMLLVDPLLGKIVDANRAACAFYGYPRDVLTNKVLSDLDAPSFGGTGTLKTTSLVMRHQLASGDIRDVTVYAGPVDALGSTTKHVCMIVQDVTKRKVAEVNEQSQRSLADALRQTAATLVSTLDQSEVIDRILTSIDTIVANKGAGIMIVEGDVARTLQLRGYADEGIHDEIINNLHLNIHDTYTLQSVIESGQPCFIGDVHEEPRWKIVPGLDWVRSHITVPIRLNNSVIGFVNVDSPIPNVYTQTDVERLQAFADQAAIAINNAQMYRRVTEQALLLEERVAERTAQLGHERAQLGAILASMTEGVIYGEMIDGEVFLRFVNPALIEATGFDEAMWMRDGIHLLKRGSPDEVRFDDLFQEGLRHLLTIGRWKSELHIPRRDGSSYLAAISAARVQREGRPFGVVAVLRDISQEKALEVQKARFVAYASHELRTPLTNMKTRLYLLKKQPQRLDEHVMILEEVTNRMRGLVEDLLDLSRFERGTLDLRLIETDLNDLIMRVVNLQREEAESKHLKLLCDLPAEPLFANVDRERLTQVITNLVVNAINYTPALGSVTVRLRSLPDKSYEHTTAIIEIQDTGIGISDENRANIFQPFFRVASDVQGTGLGLSIAREIVALHGGDITVSSILGQGSTFSVTLPQVIREPALITEAIR